MWTITLVWDLVILGTLGSQCFSRILEETLEIISFMRVLCDNWDDSRGHRQISFFFRGMCLYKYRFQNTSLHPPADTVRPHLHWVLEVWTLHRNVHTPYKLQRWISAQFASSGVSAMGNNAKRVSRAACIRTRFQICFESHTYIIHQTSALGFIRSVAPSLCVWCVSWIEVKHFRVIWTVWNSMVQKFARIFFILEPTPVFLCTQHPIRCDFNCSGWLDGWLWFGTTFRHVCHTKKITVPLAIDFWNSGWLNDNCALCTRIAHLP